ncbi:hypothetical protein ASC63_02065 [Leifsonia sp. Root112D2]|nr:hypothetical protein ASC63_02065 [Leifsonia sp. Root112D2]
MDAPGATADSATGPRTGGQRFFSWMRGLGIVRQDGWIGGVSGGIAIRLGIDALIVRGIIVVIAVLGGPVFLVYAAAWLLLPDANDDIHLERLIRGVFEPAIVGIGVLVLLAFLPLAQGVWWAGAQFWGEPYWPQSLGRGLWSVLVIGVIVAFVIWASRRSNSNSRSGGADARTASAYPTTASGADTGAKGPVPEPAEGPGGLPSLAGSLGAGVAESLRDSPSSTAPGAPTAPAEGASAEEFEAWKQRQQEWKEQHNAWRAQQDADARAIREQRSAEMRAQAQALAAQAAETRRIRRLANPRTSGAFVAITLGLAIVGGGIAALVTASTPDWRGYEVTVGFALATFVVGLAMVVAGAMRRRSGFLAFVAILLAITTVLTALPPRDRDFTFVAGYHGSDTSTRVFQPVGSYSIFLQKQDLRPDGEPVVIDVLQWAGSVNVTAREGITVRVESVRDDGGVALWGSTWLPDDTVTSQDAAVTHRSNGASDATLSYGTAKTPDVIVRVTQTAGSVGVQYYKDAAASDQTGTNK